MNSLKSRAMNCGPLSEMIRGFASGYFSRARCKNDFDFGFGHRFPQIPMNDRTAEAVQNAAQIVERAAHVDVGNIDMPMLVGCGGCSKPVPFRDGFPFHRESSTRLLEHPPNAGGTDGHDVRVQHHERQPPVAFQRILQMEVG